MFPNPGEIRIAMKSRYLPLVVAGGFGLALINASQAQQPTMMSPMRQPGIPRSSQLSGAVPQTYVWDGFEFVGRVGGKYYYLAPNNTWVLMDAARRQRYQQWQRANPNWQQRQIRNTQFPGTGQITNAAPVSPRQNNPPR
jgi:hypothetical protein